VAAFPDAAIVCPVLVGREPALAALDRLIGQALAGQGRTVLLAGEAGIGKSRLAAEAGDRFQAAARSAGAAATALAGRCFETDHLLPLAPWRDLLRAHLADRPPAELAAALGSVAPELVRLTPDLAASLPAPAPPLDPEQEKRRLVRSLVAFVAARAAEGPVLALLEDLHWADDTSLEVMAALARRAASLPVLFLATYRDDEPSPSLRRCLASLERERLTFEVALERFSADEVAAMLGHMLGPNRRPGPPFVAAVAELTDGNPFFVEEVLKALDDAVDGHEPIGPGALRLPRTVVDLVERRLARLRPATRRVLEHAAVIGQRFDIGLLRTLSGLSEPALLGHLRAAVAASLLVEVDADRLAFRHALTRQAVAGGLLARERRRLHQAIADAVGEADGAAEELRDVDLAYHCFEAGAWEPALRHAWQAGDRALAVDAPRAAVEQYSRAVIAAARLGRSPDPGLWRARARAHDRLGHFDAADADHMAALRTAQAAGDHRAAWQALLDLGFLWSGRDYVRAHDYIDSALALARTLDDPAVLAHTLNRRGNWHMNADQPDIAITQHRQALAIFEAQQDRAGIAATLDLLSITAMATGDLPAAAAYAEQAIAHFEALDDRPAVAALYAVLPYAGGGYICSLSVPAESELVTASREQEIGVRLNHGLEWRSGEALALWELALALGMRGYYGRAVAAARAAQAIAAEIAHQQWIVGAASTLGMLALDLCDLPMARQELERGLALANALGSTLWQRIVSGFLAVTAIAQGDLARASEVLAGALRPDLPMATVMQRGCWWARAELALAEGRAAEALQIADALLETAHNRERYGLSGIPRLAQLRGEALLALRRPDEAWVALQAAREGADRYGFRPIRWRVDGLLARLALSQRRATDAGAALTEARRTVAELADEAPDDMRATFLAGVEAVLPRPRPPTTLRLTKAAYGGLTAREREVAALIAQGRTNRQIAHRLAIGEATIATHVGHILTKLDLATRAEIAAWAVERGLRRPD
jgi:DNA-binding NarL/FixJ family response regulator